MAKNRFGISKLFALTLSILITMILHTIPAGSGISFFTSKDIKKASINFWSGKISESVQKEDIRKLREREHRTLSNGYSLVWDPSSIEIVMTPGLNYWELTHVYDPFVMVENGIYKMWYRGLSYNPNRIHDINALGYASSLDGVNWTNRQLVHGPVSNYRHMGDPNLLKEGGLYRMWYSGYYEEIAGDWSSYVSHITSTDGIIWSNEQKVLSAQGQTAAQGDGYDIASLCVLKNGSYYYMWYSVADHPNQGVRGPNKIWRAMSLDGMVWGNRQLALPYISGTWESDISNPHVVRNPFGDGYIMYYATEAGSLRHIGRAKSVNMINWTDRELVITTRGRSSPFFFMDPSGTPYLYFKQSNNILRMTAEITILPSQYILNISTTPGGTTDPRPGAHAYDEDTDAIVRALPNSGKRFQRWTGDASSIDNPITLMMDSDKSIKANFEKEIMSYILSIESGSGGTTNPVPGIYSHDEGTDVTITAISDSHHRFIGWSGDVSGTSNPITITMDSDKSIKANFIRIIYPPLDFTGQKVLNRSLSQAEYINVFSWQSNPNNLNIMKYRIYLIEGEIKNLLIELNANTSEYWHRRVEKNKLYTYAICAVDNEEREGDPTHITVQ